jgi:hypothetical protein
MKTNQPITDTARKHSDLVRLLPESPSGQQQSKTNDVSRTSFPAFTAAKTQMEALDKLSGLRKSIKRAAIPRSGYPPARCHLEILLYIAFIEEILHLYLFCHSFFYSIHYKIFIPPLVHTQTFHIGDHRHV